MGQDADVAKESVRPKGRDSVRTAIVEAAVDTASSAGPLSARAIARRAGVNHGQVHHLFAGKGGLHRAVLEHLAVSLDAQLEERAEVELMSAALSATVDDPRFVRFLATYLTEYPDDPVPQESFPVVERLVATLRDPDDAHSRAKLARALAAGLGWAIFQRWIQAALKLDANEITRVQALIAEAETQ